MPYLWPSQDKHLQEKQIRCFKAHFLLRPKELTDDERCSFLDAYTDAVSSGDYYMDVLATMSFANKDNVVRVMESVGQHENGIAEAKRILKLYPHDLMGPIEAHRALGRCATRILFQEVQNAMSATLR